jgi:hypothetical protein
VNRKIFSSRLRTLQVEVEVGVEVLRLFERLGTQA